MAIQSRPLTYDDLQRLRETRDERLELIEGEIVVTPAPAELHQLVVLRLGALLNHVIIEAGLGVVLPAPFNVVLDTENVVQPHLFFLLHERASQMAGTHVDGPPNLAIEILSPSTATRDRATKRDLYARYGGPEYWLINRDRQTVTVFSDPQDGRNRNEQTTDDIAVSATIPELTVDLKALFAPVPGF